MQTQNSLFLLDGMALAYRAYFAFITRPIRNSKGFNTSAVYGFANSLVQILETRKPTHLAVAFDTAAPTERHGLFPEYKAQREAMPEDLSTSIPILKQMLAAWNIECVEKDGFEADDIIGTLAQEANGKGWDVFMVTPDKDFAQLVGPHCFILKPSRQGDEVEILGVDEVRKKWGVETPEQVIDTLALWGDASDNIPGVPGVGEKTAKKLVAEFGSLENLLANTEKLKGKIRENLENHAEQARLCRKLATINCKVPLQSTDLDLLKLRDPNQEALKNLFVELEFNALGKRMFGQDFQAGRGFSDHPDQFQLQMDSVEDKNASAPEPAPTNPQLKTIDQIQKDYRLIETVEDLALAVAQIKKAGQFCFDTETSGLNPRDSKLLGIALSWEKDSGCYVRLHANDRSDVLMKDLRVLFSDSGLLKIGHNLKFDLSILRLHGIECEGDLFDTMIAHCLIEPESRHGMDYLSERYLGYTPIPLSQLIGDKKPDPTLLMEIETDRLVRYASEDADVTLQLMEVFKGMLVDQGQEKVFYQIEMPLLPALVDMELEGIQLDIRVLAEFGGQLEKEIHRLENSIHELAGVSFNLNSPKQLGEILFDKIRIMEKAKKTRTGQYATNEQVLLGLVGKHPIISEILQHRASVKLKSTYADALPREVHPQTGRIHTTFHQCLTSTGRIQSQTPNLQNIPIRTEQGKEIRKAFTARNSQYRILSADYSQIELRIMAALSGDATMIEAFRRNQDIHVATAARIYSVPLEQVDGDMRRKAKMVNFGLMYGMSAFGLSQRLGISRQESKSIMDEYFRQFPGIERFMKSTLESSREKGFAETLCGRRRYLPDINSGNATIRSAAERTAINMPIQGSAADMIKIAMSRIHQRFLKEKIRSKMLLQVHDELVFEVLETELPTVQSIVREVMEAALPMDVPIVVEVGVGENWLEAH